MSRCAHLNGFVLSENSSAVIKQLQPEAMLFNFETTTITTKTTRKWNIKINRILRRCFLGQLQKCRSAVFAMATFDCCCLQMVNDEQIGCGGRRWAVTENAVRTHTYISVRIRAINIQTTGNILFVCIYLVTYMCICVCMCV